MDATAGLQISQPVPSPVTGDDRVEAPHSFRRMRWKSSCRECGKCSQRWLETFLPARFISRGEQLAEERHTGAAAGASGGGSLDRPDRGQVLAADGLADDALGDVLAGADGGRARERIDAGQCRCSPSMRGRMSCSGPWREGGLALGEREQMPVARGFADQHPAEETLAVGAQDELLVDAGDRVGEGDDPGAGLGRHGRHRNFATSTPMSLSLVLMSKTPSRSPRAVRGVGHCGCGPSGSRGRRGRRCAPGSTRTRRWRGCPDRTCGSARR